MPGKCSAVDFVATLVERDQYGFRRDCRRNRRCFLGNPGGCIAGAALGQLMNLKAAKSELAADIVESLAIAFSELPLRPLLEPSDGDHEKAHNQAKLPRI